MSLTYGFFNSVNKDRLYQASQFSSIFDGIINDGVFDSVGGCLMVEAATGMSVNVLSGRAWFNHTWTYNDAGYLVTIPTSELLLNRIDAVVLEVNSGDTVRANSIKVVKGTPNASPVRPTLTNTDTVHQHALAYIYVGANVTSINAGNITNVVGTTDTPFVTGILTVSTIAAVFNAWQYQFDTWFENVREQLSEDPAGNLQDQIDDLDDRLTNIENSTVTMTVTKPDSTEDTYTIYGYDEDSHVVPGSFSINSDGELYLYTDSNYRGAEFEVNTDGELEVS